MELSRPEYWSGLPFPSPGNLPNPGIKPRTPALQADSLPAEPQGEALSIQRLSLNAFDFPVKLSKFSNNRIVFVNKL